MLAMLFSERFYRDSGTGILEAIGKLFTNDVKISVKPMAVTNFRSHINSADVEADWFDLHTEEDIVSIDTLTLHGPMNSLLQYLLESDSVETLHYEVEISD